MSNQKVFLKPKVVIAVVAASTFLMLGVAGLIVAAVNVADNTKPVLSAPVPVPSVSSSASASAAPSGRVPVASLVPKVPTTLPDFSSVTLTAEGWMPVPVTTDPRELGAAVAVALWSYDTGATTRATTLQHLAGFAQPTATYVGHPDWPMPNRARNLVRIANGLMKSPSDFQGMQTSGMKVTARVVAVKSDAQLSVWPKDDISKVIEDQHGSHMVTTTLEVGMASGTAGNDGQESEPQRVIVTAMVLCDFESVCGVTQLASTPQL